MIYAVEGLGGGEGRGLRSKMHRVWLPPIPQGCNLPQYGFINFFVSLRKFFLYFYLKSIGVAVLSSIS